VLNCNFKRSGPAWARDSAPHSCTGTRPTVICHHGQIKDTLDRRDRSMQQVILPTEPNKRLTVVTRSLAQCPPARQADNNLDPRPKQRAATNIEIAAGFELLARSLLAMTPASGIAVAVANETGLYCWASAGEAPQAGMPIRMENTISGQCIRTGATFYCDDTVEKCPNALPARSILLLPIMSGRKARGLVALFSRQPQAFAPGSVAIARSTAALMAVALSARLSQLDCPLDDQLLEVDLPDPATLVNPDPETTQLRAVRSSAPAALPVSRPYKTLLGLPCAKCRAYFSGLEPRCSVCNTPR
jgi:GAF domain-containing protein